MKIFLDTAEISDIRVAATTGIIDGITTNPSLIAKSGRKFAEVVKEIADVIDGPISAEVVSLTAKEMVAEAQPLLKIHPNITIKLPMTAEGIQACKELSEQGVKTNVTLVFTVNQAILAAKAGATFVSPFVGRLDDIGEDGIRVVEEIVQVFDNYHFKTEVIVASVRKVDHVRRAALAGAHIATIPPTVFHELFLHPLTTVGIEKFLSDWQSAVQ
ncbi:MAG TPA: fructose-6-phosphate aldolase [Patescibacteria group bacterium]|nr:fructose-6-phosphate aldolase [Patescibacteria group bacterium]